MCRAREHRDEIQEVHDLDLHANAGQAMTDEPCAEVEEMKHFEAENGIHNCSKDIATGLVMLSA